MPKRAGERYASALTNMNLSNRVYKYFGSVKLKDYVTDFLKKNWQICIDFIIFFIISFLPGDYCEGVIPDPIPNSEVKPFCADGTLS